MYSLRQWAHCALVLPLLSTVAFATDMGMWTADETKELGAFVKDQREQAWQLRFREKMEKPLSVHDKLRAIMNMRIAAQFNSRQIQHWINRLIQARERDLKNSSAYNTAIRTLEAYLSGGQFSYSSQELARDYADWKQTVEPAVVSSLDEATLVKHYEKQMQRSWYFFGWKNIENEQAKEEQRLSQSLKPPVIRGAAATK